MVYSGLVPLTIIPGELGSAQFEVPASLDGRPFAFQLDTGSTYTAVNHDAFTGTYPVSGTMERQSAAGKARVYEKISIGTFELGCLVHRNFEVVRLPIGKAAGHRLGMNALNAASFAVLSSQSQLALYPELPALPHELESFPGGTFGFSASIGSEPCLALWDTGAELSCVSRSFVAAHPKLFSFVQPVHGGIDATGAPVPMDLLRTTALGFGGIAVGTQLLAIDFAMIHAKLSPALNLIVGTNLIREFDWYFDRQHGRYRVARALPTEGHG